MSAPYYEDDMVTLHHGDAETVAATLEPRSVQTIVTSPPYYGLRDYGVEGQLGAESSVQEYVDRMVALFRSLRDVLADDGTLWINLGDSYSASISGTGGYSEKSTLSGYTSENTKHRRENDKPGRRIARTVPPKNLLGVPWRVAFALQADGWILRSDIIWAKPNPMPESVTDRPTKAHEYLFLFAKSPSYYYDADAIAETAKLGPGDTWEERKAGGAQKGVNRSTNAGTKQVHRKGRHNLTPQDGKRNRRTVWDIATVPFPGSHFAVYPPELIRPCILAGSRIGDTVLDPFSGSGTTGMVATQEGRRYIGIDLNSEYLDLSLRSRFAQPVLDLTGGAA